MEITFLNINIYVLNLITSPPTFTKLAESPFITTSSGRL